MPTARMYTRLEAEVTYITPSPTRGVALCAPVGPHLVRPGQAEPPTVWVLTFVSGLNAAGHNG